MPDSFDPERIQRLIRAAYAVSTSPCPALYITFEATQTAANELVKKWKKNGNGAPNFQLTWEAHVALYINELETRLLTDKPSNPPLPLLFPLMGPSFQAPHHMLHHHTSTSTSSPKIRLSDLKTAPISFISEVFNPELKACVFEGCSGGKVINRGVNDQGARDVYGVFRDERSFAPKRFECTKCKRTFALGTAAMTSKVKLWEVPNNLNRFSSRSGVTSDLNDLICELRPYTLTGKIVRALRRESVSTLSDHKLRLMILLYGYPELHLLYSHRSHHTYLSYLATQPATLTFSNRAPQQFYSEAEVTLLERARDAEGKADPDAEDLEEEEEGRQEEGVRVEAGGGTLSGVERLQRGDVGEKEKAGGGRAKAFSPTKDIVNDVYTAFAQHQRIPENEQWTRTRSVKVLVIDTSFAYTNRAKITVAGTVDDKRKGAAPIPREIAFSGGVLSGLNEHSEGVVLRVMMSQTHKELEEVLESLAGRVKALEGTVLGVGYDKCCEIEQLSKRVFGTQCRSVMDKYHFYQRILATIVAGIRNSRYKEVSADLRAAIVKTPASKGKVAVTWSREEQLEKMEAVREKYRLAGNVWTTGPGSSETVWESQLAHVRKGCLSTQGSLKKLRSDESRVELWHHTLKGMQARVAGGIINMSLQIHDAFLRRNLRMGAKAGKHSRLNAFRLTSYGSHHLFLVNRINSLYNKVFRTSDKRPLFEDVDSGETFGLVANNNPSPPKVLRFSPSQIYILNIMCVDPRSTSRGLTSRDHYRFEKLFLEHGWRSDWKELELRKAANEYFDLDGGPHDKVRRDWKIIRDLCVKTEKNIRGWQRRKLEKDPTLTSYATPFLNLTIPPAAEAKSNVKVCLRCGVAVSGAGRGNNAHKKVYCSDGVRQIHINIPYPQPPQLFDSGVISAGEAKRLLRKLRGEGMVLDAQMERFIWMVAQFPRDISGQIRWEGFEMAGKTWEQTDWSRTDGVMTTEAQKTMVEPISQYIFRHLRD
ncbi:hypothetical protein P7C70_g1321, partial [Phenoliferia sp. Uapishka_3]